MAGRFLQLFKPISRFIPEVGPPERSVSFNEKLFWTGLVLAVYLVMSEVPLFGIGRTGNDPFLYLRVIFASKRGTLMELGIGPIVTAGLILQLLAGSGLIACDFSNAEDRGLFTVASKILSLVMTAVQASAYLIGGAYGSLDARTSLVVFMQLLFAGLIVMLLDELVQKGWGIGSGISLFIMAGVAQNIIWSCLAPIYANDNLFFGALVAAIQNAASGGAIERVLIRPGNLPTLIGFVTTIVMFLVIIYLQGIQLELPITYASYRGFRGRYPIKLLYVSNLPVIFASSLFANIFLISQLLWRNFNQNNRNFWLNILGMYTLKENRQVPIGGLAYYVTSPQNITGVMNDPVRAVAYLTILVVFCVLFSLTWLEVGGLDPKTVARQLVGAGMQIPGYRRSQKTIELLLKRYIPIVTVFGGLLIGLIAGLADFLGVFGSGTGILLSVGIIYQYYQLLAREKITEMYPVLKGFFGGR